MLRASTLLLLLNVWLMMVVVFSDNNKTKEYDVTLASLNTNSTASNRVVYQVKKIVNDIRLQTKTAFEQLTGAQKPSELKETINATGKPLGNMVGVNKKKKHRNKLKTSTTASTTPRQPTVYYGALNRRFREQALVRPPEVIDN